MSWESCKQNLRDKLSDQIYQQHIDGLVMESIQEDQNRATVIVPPEADISFLNQSLKGLIEYAYFEESKRQVQLDFIQRKLQAPSRPNTELGEFFQFPKVNLNSEYNFDSFVVGSNSQFAFSAAQAVANSPGNTKFNPLLIYGGSGLGKTHLIQAIGNHIKEHHPTKNVRYITANDFMREYVESLKNSTITEFSNYYRNEVDLLLMDDVQFLSGKTETQNEFFHIFNALHQNGKQVILTSDHVPSEVKGLEERLISRFQWGLCVDIQPPDVETREAIIRKKADIENLPLTDEIIEYLAVNIEGSVRLIEGAIRKLILQASLKNNDISLSLAKEIVASTPRNTPKRINSEDVINVISEYFSVESDKILEGGRGTKEVAQARQVAMYLLKELSSLSLKSIGKRFGDRDHSTVVHAIKTTQKLMINDPAFRRSVESLKSKIQG